jgi:ABC-type Fe3+ transport system substrate-binding protein
VHPTGYTTASSGSLVLTEGAPHPNAGKVFINWVLSRDGQTAYSMGLTQASRRLDVPRDHLNPQTVPKPRGKYWPAYTEDNVRLPPELEQLLRELFPG